MRKYILMLVFMFVFGTASLGYSDVNGNKYIESINNLSEIGLVSGYPDGSFKPNAVVTRAELAKLIVSATGGIKDTCCFTFADSSTHWAASYINSAAYTGYVVGYDDGNFKPNDTVTYAEAITMMTRALGYRSVEGIWPTNYISKANDLGILSGVDKFDNSKGITRDVVSKILDNVINVKLNNMSSLKEIYYGSVNTPSMNNIGIQLPTGTFRIEAATPVGVTPAGAFSISEAGDIRVIPLVVGEILVTSNVNVVFVNVDGSVDTSKGLSDIGSSMTIYGAQKITKASVSDADVYDIIIVKI